MAPNNSLWGKLMAQLGESFPSLIPSFRLDPITSTISYFPLLQCPSHTWPIFQHKENNIHILVELHKPRPVPHLKHWTCPQNEMSEMGYGMRE